LDDKKYNRPRSQALRCAAYR